MICGKTSFSILKVYGHTRKNEKNRQSTNTTLRLSRNPQDTCQPQSPLLVAPRTSDLTPSICDYFITKLHGELRTKKPSPLADYIQQPSENSRNKGRQFYKEYRTCGITPAALSAFEDTNHMAKALPSRG